MRRFIAPFLALLLVASTTWFYHCYDQRKSATLAVSELARVFADPAQPLSSAVSVPASLADKATAERESLLRDYLDTELSPAGLAELSENGAFGSLASLFPDQADAWAKPYAVTVSECVAFKLQRGAFTAELVLHRRKNGTFAVLRANDIRQLAEPLPTP